MLSLLSKRFFLPILAALASFILFQLALHEPINARAFSSLKMSGVLAASEFDGVYTHLFTRLIHSIFNDPELTFRLLTALATGFSVYFIQKLFPFEQKWNIGYVVANISLLYFALHSPHAMLTVLVFTAFLTSWESAKATSLPMSGLLASLMLGFDSLLALALIVYTLVRITGSGARDKTKVVGVASTLLGLAVWVLLAYMLYAAIGFTTALGVGLRDLFKQINPINFGVGLIVTFNLLLIWVFRSPSEQTTTKYLGSLLIALFLFVKVEPVHLLLLLILGVSYLSKVGGLPKQQWVQPAYAMINIGAFFLLPHIEPLEAAYNVRAAKESEARLFYASYFSKHLPSYQALIKKRDMLESTTDFFARQRSQDPIILDPALEVVYDRAALRALSAGHAIGGFDMEARRFRSAFDKDTSMMQMVKGSGRLHYFATTARPGVMDSLFPGGLEMGSGITLFTIDGTQYESFFDAYIYHHYRSFH